MTEDERGRNAQRQAEDHQHQRLSHDHAYDPTRVGAQRDADADFPRTLPDGVGDDPADTGRGDEERDGGEHAEQQTR
jgi:hypothetical protein